MRFKLGSCIWQGDKVEEIPVSSVEHDGAKTFTPKPTDKDVRALCQEIRQSGRIDPILVERVSGRLRVRDGNHRLVVCRMLGRPTIPAVIVRRVKRIKQVIPRAIRRGRPRQFVSNAAKQRAYRQRKLERLVPIVSHRRR